MLSLLISSSCLLIPAAPLKAASILGMTHQKLSNTELAVANGDNEGPVAAISSAEVRPNTSVISGTLTGQTVANGSLQTCYS